MQRIGIYPGTFDPIHKGHLAFALESIKVCNLNGVIFLPELKPRYKSDVSSLKERFEQIHTVIKPHSSLSAQLLTSPQFTVEGTLPEIQKLYENMNLTLLIGSDVALSLSKWTNLDTLLVTCDVAIGMRSRHSLTEVHQALDQLKQRHLSTRFTIVQTEYPSLASSQFRTQK